MVFIESKKYACETCIKGHRSSACKHTDRPLFEIKKKGRPVTQCEHCRELRKTKQVHVKCICELKTDTIFTNKKAGAKAPESAAAFPNGLPEALAMEASVAHHPDARPTAMISDPSSVHGGVVASSTCCCMTGESCNCWTPRKSRPRRKTDSALSTSGVVVSPLTKPHTAPSSAAAATASALDVHSPSSPNEAPTPRAASHILARISELRPVLPRPSAHHDPSSGVAHGHPNRHHHHHESTFFSPYGRAYDINHPHPLPHTTADDTNPLFSSTSTFGGSSPPKPQIYDSGITNSIPVAPNGVSNSNGAASITFPSPCGCGDGCSCPGCFHHNNAPFAPSLTAYPTCSNPASCHACLDCTILSLPPDTALSIPEPQQTEAIDEWIRQVEANPDSSTMMTLSGAVDGGGQFNGWDSLAQLTAGRRQCTTCTSFFCTCEKDGDHPSNEAASCCDKPKLPSSDMGTVIQGGYNSSDFLGYPMLGMQSVGDVYLDTATMEALRSRSPSISPHTTQDSFAPQFLSTTFSYPALVDRMPASQQSMYINGRGFYSDPYLSLSSNERAVDGFTVLNTATPFLAPPLSNVDYPPGTYAVSNPDSDTSSYDSVDDVPPPPPPPPQMPLEPQFKQIHRSSVSPVSFEGVRTLY